MFLSYSHVERGGNQVSEASCSPVVHRLRVCSGSQWVFFLQGNQYLYRLVRFTKIKNEVYKLLNPQIQSLFDVEKLTNQTAFKSVLVDYKSESTNYKLEFGL